MLPLCATFAVQTQWYGTPQERMMTSLSITMLLCALVPVHTFIAEMLTT